MQPKNPSVKVTSRHPLQAIISITDLNCSLLMWHWCPAHFRMDILIPASPHLREECVVWRVRRLFSSPLALAQRTKSYYHKCNWSGDAQQATEDLQVFSMKDNCRVHVNFAFMYSRSLTDPKMGQLTWLRQFPPNRHRAAQLCVHNASLSATSVHSKRVGVVANSKYSILCLYSYDNSGGFPEICLGMSVNTEDFVIPHARHVLIPMDLHRSWKWHNMFKAGWSIEGPTVEFMTDPGW